MESGEVQYRKQAPKSLNVNYLNILVEILNHVFYQQHAQHSERESLRDKHPEHQLLWHVVLPREPIRVNQRTFYCCCE